MWWIFDKMSEFSDYLLWDWDITGQTQPNTRPLPIYDDDWKQIWDYEAETDSQWITTVKSRKIKPFIKQRMSHEDKVLYFISDESKIWKSISFVDVWSPYFVTPFITCIMTRLRQRWYIENAGRDNWLMTYKITPQWREYLVMLLRTLDNNQK